MTLPAGTARTLLPGKQIAGALPDNDDHMWPYAGHRRKTVLVTGAAGFVGSIVALNMTVLGWNVIGVDPCYHGESAMGAPPYQLIRKRIQDIKPNSLDVDYIMHLGTLDQVSCLNEPEQAKQDVYVSTLACLDWNVPMTFTSSVSVLTHPRLTENPYAYYKEKAETACMLKSSDVQVFRLSNVYGPGMKLDSPLCGFPGKVARALCTNDLLVVTAPDLPRYYTYIGNVASYIVAQATSADRVGGVSSCLGNQPPLTPMQVIGKMADIMAVIKPDFRLNVEIGKPRLIDTPRPSVMVKNMMTSVVFDIGAEALLRTAKEQYAV